ncbi:MULTISPECIES: competence protein ComJ [Bacillus]|uniref:DNA-entry nuclease n=1 Tax=Bacillus pumilus TaxID=1408 RepID=A0A2G8IXD1_BACPU|nr:MULTISPECIES: competence protein ComJ [Bacillus]MCC9089711.1 competence protein ComJ [Bacillus pumilus]MED1747623.1 competence protein ComJ [Bacillus zhangzhouensis]PIK28176.1 DNA-entry nuclease [Bacillus pumilus]UUD43088.1 competence protein ComJ [Bacillus pumilus]
MNDLNQTYSLSISYHQITVYAGSDTPPVIDWTDDDILQGFATGDQGVSFEGVNNGKAFIFVTLNENEPPASFDRVITVPFTHSSDQVHITSVMAQVLSFSIPKGDYQLTCYTSQQPDQDLYYFHFQTV